MWKGAKWGVLALAVAIAIVLSGVVGHTLGGDGGTTTVDQPSVDSPTTATTTTTTSQDFGILDEIYRVLAENFVDPDAVSPELLGQGAIKGILDALGDTHTTYIDPVSFSLGTDIINGTFQGIGAQVEQDPVTRDIVIVTPFRGSPAEEAGIQPGDVILAVDGESTEGWSTTDAVQRIRGPEGSPVGLRIQHRNGDVVDVTIVRSTIVIPTVFTQDVTDEDGNVVPDIAYIELQQFTEQSVPDLSKELSDIQEQGYRGLILDLRRNPGGALSATVDVTDMFLEEGLILTERNRSGVETRFEARPGGEATDIPMVVLIGPGSASGSEVLASALHANGRATLVGEASFGKGTVNQLFPLSDGGAIYVTTARWLTPSGEQVEGVGLAPDHEIVFTDEDLDLQRDTQLFFAIDFLRENFLQAQ